MPYDCPYYCLCLACNTIPEVDLSLWRSRSYKKQFQFADDITDTCHRVGTVFVVNQGIPKETIEEAFEWTRKLNHLTPKRKMLALQSLHPPGPSLHRGSSRPPKDPLPGFKEFATGFSKQLLEIGENLRRAIAVGLGLEEYDWFLENEFFSRYHTGVNDQLRFLRYRPVEVERGEVARMPAYSNWGTFTMMFQDRRGGLQVEDRDRKGGFVDVKPRMNVLVMSVGDSLMRWSNDYLRSNLHRMTLSFTSQDGGRRLRGGQKKITDYFTANPLMTRSRYAISYFFCATPDAEIECLPTCVEKGKRPRYPPVTQEEYEKMRARGNHAGGEEEYGKLRARGQYQ
ncbi:hypothetical protein F4808DRAFT_409136 [Astrocystis sublimbata]|nr:hypothetical protein F4808DRAFT_409136 [Astrocystis sublimbata]